MSAFTIGSRRAGPEEPAYIIAEAGSNHNGDRKMAKELVDMAAEAGADAVKFQTFTAETMYPTDSAELGNAEEDDAYGLMKQLEMPPEWIPELATRAEDRGIDFLSSPFYREAVDQLDEVVPAFKLASTLVSHHPFLEYVAATDKPLIVSTGAHTMDAVEEMVATLEDAGIDELALLQCTSAYPTPLEAANVGVLKQYQDRFGYPVGLSDHTVDPTTAPVVATALGASIIEKHVTLDSSLDGPDHGFALEPDELERMVEAIRDAETALGDGEKRVLDVERETYENGRRCIHAARDLSAGSRLSDDDIVVLRPGENERGIPPKAYERVLGTELANAVSANDSITAGDLVDDVEPER
jgi:N-acetylneuraminate synthase